VTWSLLGTLNDLVTYLLTWIKAAVDNYSWARTEKYTCDKTWQKSTANLVARKLLVDRVSSAVHRRLGWRERRWSANV